MYSWLNGCISGLDVWLDVWFDGCDNGLDVWFDGCDNGRYFHEGGWGNIQVDEMMQEELQD